MNVLFSPQVRRSLNVRFRRKSDAGNVCIGPKAELSGLKRNCLSRLRCISTNFAYQSVNRPSNFATQAPQPNMEPKSPSIPKAKVARPMKKTTVTAIMPSKLWLPKATAPPRPVMGNAKTARSGRFHLLSAAGGRKESAFTTECIRQLMPTQ